MIVFSTLRLSGKALWGFRTILDCGGLEIIGRCTFSKLLLQILRLVNYWCMEELGKV
jgi:hypothetical protein